MDTQDIVTKLYTKSQDSKDVIAQILYVMSLVPQNKAEEVFKLYTSLQTGKTLIAQVFSRIGLETSQKEAIESKLKAQFDNQEVLFSYVQNEDLDVPLKIIIGDKVLEYSL